jgi:hypothetical protein
MTPDPAQPELPLDLPLTRSEHRREGEGGTRQTKESDPDAVKWQRVHTLERCHACIAEQKEHLDGADGSPHVAWPASYVRTERDRREALCFTHAAPRRQAEGLRKQRSTDPNRVKPKR